jgi:hypothetical protein
VIINTVSIIIWLSKREVKKVDTQLSKEKAVLNTEHNSVNTMSSLLDGQQRDHGFTFHTGCEALPASCPPGSRSSSSDSRVARAMKLDSQLPLSAKVKNAWNYTYSPPYIFIS